MLKADWRCSYIRSHRGLHSFIFLYMLVDKNFHYQDYNDAVIFPCGDAQLWSRWGWFMYNRHFLTILHLYTNISSPPPPLYRFHYQLTSTQSHTLIILDNMPRLVLCLCEEGILFGSHTLNRLRKKGLARGKECKIIFGGRHHKDLEYFFKVNSCYFKEPSLRGLR